MEMMKNVAENGDGCILENKHENESRYSKVDDAKQSKYIL
jgi:hypothetical protein